MALFIDNRYTITIDILNYNDNILSKSRLSVFYVDKFLSKNSLPTL